MSIIRRRLTRKEHATSAEPLPVPGRSSPVDAADDFFRVRLICTLLDTCGMCFDKGSSKKRLDQYLIVFQVSLLVFTALPSFEAEILCLKQLYILCKKSIPMDVEFMVQDTLDVSTLRSTLLARPAAYLHSLAQTVRPDLKPFKTFEEASQVIDALLATQSLASVGQSRAPVLSFPSEYLYKSAELIVTHSRCP